MDVLRIYQDYGVTHLTEGHKHCRPGWVNTSCPHCSGNEGFHLGWNIDENYYRCWRCGWHPMGVTLSLLLNVKLSDLTEITKNYGVLRSYVKQLPKGKRAFTLPINVEKMGSMHTRYLKMRNYNPDKIERIWGVKGTGPLSFIDNIDYRFRLLIPINWNNEMVSFDTRDITGQSDAKYKACPTDREIIGRKEILYGNQDAWTDTGICVEGELDVWRLGERAFSLSGINYTPAQVRVIANIFKKVAVVFDGAVLKGEEAQAKIQARKLIKDLQFRNVEAYTIEIKGDPGSLSPRDAKRLVKNV